jgi:hypothetical protein
MEPLWNRVKKRLREKLVPLRAFVGARDHNK